MIYNTSDVSILAMQTPSAAIACTVNACGRGLNFSKLICSTGGGGGGGGVERNFIITR